MSTRTEIDKKLQQYLDEAFAPYGDFPARADVTQELLANLSEKYHYFKQQGKNDDEAYQITVDSFGDVSEIMAQVPHKAPMPTPLSNNQKDKNDRGLFKTIFQGVKEATGNAPTAMASDLTKADLTDSDRAARNFSMSALVETSFDRSDLHDAKFRVATLNDASFAGANLRNAVFYSSDLRNVTFDGADLSDATFSTSDLTGATLNSAKLVKTEFNKCDLSGISFEGLTLDGIIFNKSSLNGATFTGAVLRNVSFHHSDVKHAVFEGATMDKLTYALLEGAKATLEDVVTSS